MCSTRSRPSATSTSAEVMIEGDRVHSGLTDLRVTDTGHVAKEA